MITQWPEIEHEQRSATTIQALFRGYRLRKEFKETVAKHKNHVQQLELQLAQLQGQLDGEKATLKTEEHLIQKFRHLK